MNVTYPAGVRRRVAALLPAVVCATAATAAAPDTSPSTDELFRELRIERVECSAETLESLRDNVSVACGRSEDDFDAFAESWSRAVKKKPEKSWMKDGKKRRAQYVLYGGTLVMTTYRLSDRTVVLARIVDWPACEGRTADLLRRSLASAGKRAGTDPESIHKVEPEYPEAARRARANGAVLLAAVIEPTGMLTRSCVVAAAPPGYGFEESAVAALKRWRYAPAVRDGEPVAVAGMVVTTFEISTGSPPLSRAFARLFRKR